VLGDKAQSMLLAMDTVELKGTCCQSMLLSIRILHQDSNARMRLCRRGITEMRTAAHDCLKEKSAALKAPPEDFDKPADFCVW
jgi:hypothetical protein